ncbi:HrpJ domain-containing protein [Parendozoicomonas haliclonae]|uniref:HrpJ-like domain protein n=1 Tax=Parendozoicomonas haliclonae TaxID=1960125 RepID=A0A1X7AEY6_9GAMM|nr:HrpJ domain-containing protein [Parendozoicomonas haliclonae]SMA36167.1 HrpJ-like domain protein [Parendozoicomonas haliclonae]
MSSVGGVSGPVATDSSLPVNQGSSSSNVEGMHSQFSKVSVGPASADFFEEASITLSSLRKFESKDSKKDKDIKKELERLKETVPDLPGMEKMEKFLQQLHNAKNNGELTEDQIKEFIEEYSGDPTHQYLAMEALIEHLQTQGEDDQELAATLKIYNDNFYEQNRKDIQSGINVSAAASDYAEQSGFSSVQELRDIWRQGLDVPDFQQPLEAYQFAKEKCGYDEIEKGVKWLMEALSVEMSALTPSVDPNHLKHVRGRLEVIYGLQTIIEFSKENENVAAKLVNANA